MLVKNWMSKHVVTVDVNDSMENAIKLMREKNIRMLPVLKKGKPVGVVTDRDLKKASASDATTLDVHELLYLLSQIKIKNIMSKTLITVPEDLSIEETAQLLIKHKISGVPVVDTEGNVVGTITQTDLFRVIISLTGVGKRGIQFAFQVDDRPGSIKDIADIVREFNGRMVSILTSYENVPQGFRKVFIRMHSIDRIDLDALIKAFEAKATLLYMVDHRDNTRKIFQ